MSWHFWRIFLTRQTFKRLWTRTRQPATGGGGIQTAEITEIHLEERPNDLHLGSVTTCQLHAAAGATISTDD